MRSYNAREPRYPPAASERRLRSWLSYWLTASTRDAERRR